MQPTPVRAAITTTSAVATLAVAETTATTATAATTLYTATTGVEVQTNSDRRHRRHRRRRLNSSSSGQRPTLEVDSHSEWLHSTRITKVGLPPITITLLPPPRQCPVTTTAIVQ
jgi:hypothetical protein